MLSSYRWAGSRLRRANVCDRRSNAYFGDDLAHLGRVVAAQRFDLSTEVRPPDQVEQGPQQVRFVQLAGHYQVVALLQERHEVQVQRPSSSQNAEAGVG